MSEEGLSATENTNDVAHGTEATDAVTTPVESKSTEEAKVDVSATLLTSAEGTEETSKTEGSQEAGKQETAPEEGKSEEGAPESYESFKTPEGTSFDSEVENVFKTAAKELNLSQEKAQSLVDKMAPVMVERQMAQIQMVSAQWAEKSKTDPEIGGANLPQTLASVAKVRDTFAKNADGTFDKDIEEFMRSPMGNHPGVLKLLARAGRAFGEAQFPNGSRAAAEKEYTATDFYRDAINK